MPTTIIDFSPQALEIDQVAQAAATINPNIPAPAPATAGMQTNPNANRTLGQTFSQGAPDILFVAEYADQNTPAVGVLVVWENYYSATHYEVFKRVVTAQDDSWQRILIIDKNHLATETARYNSYILQRLNLSPNVAVYAILDTDFQSDQIVEYKVAAGNYPTSSVIDYELILNSKGLLKSVSTTQTENIYDFSQRILGSSDYAWIVALFNHGAQFFGKSPVTIPLQNYVGYTALVPSDLSNMVRAIQESIYYFGTYATLQNLFNYLADTSDTVGNSNFFPLTLQSINTATNTLSYTLLQAKLLVAYPEYDDYIARLKSGTATGSPLIVPNYADQSTFNSLPDLTNMFLRLNTMLVGVLYANDNDTALQLASYVKPPTRNITSPPPPNPLSSIGLTLPKTVTTTPTIAGTSPFGNGLFNNGGLL